MVYRYARGPKMSRRRLGVTYNINQSGTGRIIFNETKTKFQGLLLGAYDECISFRGRITAETDDPSTSMMTVTIVDGESGNEFQVENVSVNFARNPNPISSHFFVTIDSPCIKFTTNEVLYGNRADVEIRKYMDPTMVESGSQVHIGHMSVHLMANHRPKPSVRHESICDDCNPAILEVSDDFLA
uniref:VWFD domain-containing protein n=1 Tax=Ascaris lumbricoides TaxID=6252 RepID=A0A9J2PAW0_ASCLU